MDHLEQLLSQFLVTDNLARKHAEEEIKRLAKDPAIVAALLQEVRTSHSPEVRQLAAVLLRKRIAGHWLKLTPELREEVKNTLLQNIVQEPSPLVRRASADVVSVIAKHAVPAGEWPGLLQFLFQCSQSPQEEHREVALTLFTSLTETIGDVLKPHFSTLQAVFVSGLKDQHSNRVRVAALKAVGALVEWAFSEQEVMMFRELVPPILDVARFCLAHGDEDIAIKAFEIFDELIESPAPLLGPSLPAILQFALEVASNKNYEVTTRNQATQLVVWMARYKPKTLLKARLVGPILELMCPMLAELDPSSDEDMSAHRFAQQVLDTVAIHLPKKHVFPPVLAFARQHIQNPDANFREAAVMSLGVIAEGCSEVMRKKLGDVLPVILAGLKDPTQIVRGSASFALGQFAEHLQPEIVEQYGQVLPQLFTVLNDTDPAIQEKAFYALAAYCEHLREEILPFLGPLMTKLMEALHSTRRDLQLICLSAVGSAASASETSFLPYAEGVLAVCKRLMQLSQDEDLAVRARATELVGIVGLAVGRENVEPLLPGFMEDALKGFALDYSELREYTHGFFGTVAEILEADFAKYLPHVVPAVLASCNMDDGQLFDSDDEDHPPPEGGSGIAGVSSDEDTTERNRDARGLRNLSIRTGVLDEKAAATQALGLFALHTKGAFVPYLEEALGVLKRHAGYFHEDVRNQAAKALESLLIATKAAFPVGVTAGESQSLPIAPQVKHVLDTVMELYLRALRSDEDKETVAQVCVSLVEVMKAVGRLPLEQYLEPLSAALIELLKGEADCQLATESNSDGEGDEEEAEHDEVLMDAVTDLMPALAELLGQDYAVLFRMHIEPLLKYSKPTRPPSDRTMVIATIAEATKYMGAAIAPYVDVIMPLAVKDLGCEEAANRRNAAFCIGKLCEAAPEQAQPYFERLLPALYPLFGPDEEDGVRDNAASAVARMITSRPEALPLQQVLPVFVNALPLKEDLEEAGPVYSCLCQLIASRPEATPFIPQAVSVFGQVVASEDVSEEVKSGVGQAVAGLYAQYRDQLQPLLANLPPDQAAAMAQRMGHS